jgi:xylulokinase
MLPAAAEAGVRVGTVSGEGAKRFGLPPGIPLAAGGSDFLMALLGSGVVHPGMTCDRAGTSEGINYCSDKNISHPRVRTLPHAVPGYFNVAGILSSTGLVFEWFRRLTGQQNRSYEIMLDEIEKAAFSPVPLFFPSLHRGAVWEFSGGAFSGLQPDHGPVELGVGVVSAIGFGIRDCIEGLAGAGCSVSEMRLSGGQGRNRVWNRMKADITGTPLQIPRLLDCELTGAAAAVFTMLDEAESISEVADSLVRIVERYEPDPVNRRTWEQMYRSYCEQRDKGSVIGPEQGH